MKTKLNIFLTIVIGLLFITCAKKTSTNVDVAANVYMVKLVDSLPCKASIVYSDYTHGNHQEEISSNWSVHHNLHYNQTVILKATGLSNIKSLTVEIVVGNTPTSNSCNGSTCTTEIRKVLYN